MTELLAVLVEEIDQENRADLGSPERDPAVGAVSGGGLDDPLGCAESAAEAVRVLNHATRPAVTEPTGAAEVYAVLGTLALLAGRLPQALTQLRELVATEHAVGRLRILNGPHTDDPAAAVTDLARQMCWAASSAEALRTALEQARATLTLGGAEHG